MLVLDVTTVFPFLHPTKTDCASTQYYTPHKDWLWKYTVLYTPQKLTMEVHSIIHPTMTDHASTQYYTLTCALRIFPHQWWQTHRCQRPCWFPWSPRLYHLTWGPSLAWYQSLQGPANRCSKGSLCILCLWLEAENRSLQRRVIPCNETVSLIIVRLEICKAPTLQIKAMNKHSISHIMSIEMEMLSTIKIYIRKKRKRKSWHIM